MFFDTRRYYTSKKQIRRKQQISFLNLISQTETVAPHAGAWIETFANLKAAGRYLYNSLSRGGGGAPDIGLMDQMCFESYEASLDDKTRYMSTSGPVTLGFDSIKFKNQDLIWDEMVPDVDGGYTYDSSDWSTSTWMMINTNFMELVVDSGTDFITTPFVRPENQDAKVAQILAMMNLTCSNLRKQGMIYGITAGITSQKLLNERKEI